MVDQARVLNLAGLRMPDEFVRHKLLDAVGDLALAGAPLRGRFVAHRSGHTLNHRLLQALFADRLGVAGDHAGAAFGRRRVAPAASRRYAAWYNRRDGTDSPDTAASPWSSSLCCRCWAAAAARRTRTPIPPRRVAPVEDLYNNGIDALNAQPLRVGDRPVQPGGAELSVFELGGERPAHAGLHAVSAEPLHRGDRHAGPLHPAPSGAPRRGLCLLSAGALLLRADRRHPARPARARSWR